MRRNRVKSVCVNVHPSFYEKMELVRKELKEKNNLNLSQVEVTNILSKRIRMPKINLFGLKNVKKK